MAASYLMPRPSATLASRISGALLPFLAVPPLRRFAAALMLASIACGCGPPPDPPNVIVYVIDTLRADVLSVYGDSPAFTPNIERFAQEGLRVESSIAPSSWTRASLATLLTGLAPETHGVLGRKHTIHPSLPLLQEQFRDAGYATAGVIGNPNLGRVYGFARGFDAFFELFEAKTLPSATQVTAQTLAWLETAPRPFFLFVLAVDPHAPYEPPAPHDLYRPPPGNTNKYVKWRHAYYGEVNYADKEFGVLMDALRATGELDRTLVVLTSDHGEEFGEHGRLGHGKNLYQTVLHIPLLLRYPPMVPAGDRLAGPVEHVDLHQTIRELASLPSSEELPGRNFLARSFEPAASPIVTHIQLDDFYATAITDPPWKLVLNPPAGPVELYDLEADPLERVNRAREHPERVATMRKTLEETRARRKAERRELRKQPAREVQDSELSEATRRSLEALGYIEPSEAPAPQ
jgi:arylsulfatase A-like enzyme